MSKPSVDLSERIYSGVLLTSLAYLLFSSQDAAIKLLVAGMSVWQIMFFRSVTVLVGAGLFGGPAVFGEAWRSPVVKPMISRSVLILAAWLCYYSASKHLQLAEMTTIYFAAPVIVTVLGVIVLAEKVPLARWVAVLVGFLGVFIACDPANLGISVPVALVLASAFLWALSIVMLRKMALQERTIIQVVLNNVFFLVVSLPVMIALWKTPSLEELLLLVATGALGGFAQFALFEGMKRAPVSVLAPFEYTSLVWSFILGFLIWGDVPRREVTFGAALIVMAGVIVIVHEQFRRRGALAQPSH
ncbi:MAG: DMT family transporter [Rhizobiaceae bacterium]|nr:DMT family transporter [Rhizobiaceae bacterium]